MAPGLSLNGRIDRIDVAAGEAIVYDYKGASASPWPHWASKRRLQMGLYILAARRFLEEDPVGGLYQPLRDRTGTRPRGAILRQADPDQWLYNEDRLEAEAFEEALAGVLALALSAAQEMRAGMLEARPGTCAFRDGEGCQYPSICGA